MITITQAETRQAQLETYLSHLKRKVALEENERKRGLLLILQGMTEAELTKYRQ